MLQYLPRLPQKSLVYFDPPYFNKANTLYQNHYIPPDHLRISQIIQNKIFLPWIVSYDNDPTILSYYKECEKFIYSLQYNAARAYIGKEIFVFSEKLVIPSYSSLSFINHSLQLREMRI
jgi:DNA adenine methylase